MRNKELIIPLIILLVMNSCSVNNYIQKGEVLPKDFVQEIAFTTAKTVIILPIEINGTTSNFLFDTGAQLTHIQRDTISGKTFTIHGASNRTVKNGSETVKSMKIGEVNFINTFANNGDLAGLKEQIPNFGGILGQPIIGKANWLINYPDKTVKISNRHLADDSYTNLKMDKSTSKPMTYITINGKEYRVIIDSGSSSTLNIPKDSEMAKDILSSIDFKENERDRYTVGGLQTIKEQIGNIPLVTIGGMRFTDVYCNINNSSQPRIGLSFFENCMIYIDNTNGHYSIKKIK